MIFRANYADLSDLNEIFKMFLQDSFLCVFNLRHNANKPKVRRWAENGLVLRNSNIKVLYICLNFKVWAANANHLENIR